MRMPSLTDPQIYLIHLYLSPVEPLMLNLSLPLEVAVTIRATVENYEGTPLPVDTIAFTLFLMPKSQKARRQPYNGAVTDVDLGQIEFTVPADDLTDPNGYNLEIYCHSTVPTQLVAKGEVSMVGYAATITQPA